MISLSVPTIIMAAIPNNANAINAAQAHREFIEYSVRNMTLINAQMAMFAHNLSTMANAYDHLDETWIHGMGTQQHKKDMDDAMHIYRQRQHSTVDGVDETVIAFEFEDKHGLLEMTTVELQQFILRKEELAGDAHGYAREHAATAQEAHEEL